MGKVHLMDGVSGRSVARDYHLGHTLWNTYDLITITLLITGLLLALLLAGLLIRIIWRPSKGRKSRF